MSTYTIPAAVWEHHRPGEPLVAGIVEGGWQDLHFEYVHEGDILVWGPNIHGANDGSRDDLPEGWVATCSCGWSSTGHSSEEAADDAATIHEDGLDIDATLIGASIATPPADLAALADARCKTCGQEPGLVGVVRLDLDGFDRCPDCHDGRLLVEVRVRCNVCTDDDPGEMIWPESGCLTRCDGCDGDPDGYRTVTGLIDLMPVVRDSREIPENCIIVRDDGKQFLLKHDGRRIRSTSAHVTALADACGRQPDEWVGGWAWLFTEVKR